MKVNTTLYMRDNDLADYKEHLRQEGLAVDGDSLDTGIDWWFTGGDCVLDKIVIDKMDYIGPDWPKGKDACVKEGSEVKAFKTALEDDSD